MTSHFARRATASCRRAWLLEKRFAPRVGICARHRSTSPGTTHARPIVIGSLPFWTTETTVWCTTPRTGTRCTGVIRTAHDQDTREHALAPYLRHPTVVAIGIKTLLALRRTVRCVAFDGAVRGPETLAGIVCCATANGGQWWPSVVKQLLPARVKERGEECHAVFAPD